MNILTRLKQPVLIFLFLFLFCFSLYPEKWVGQCATYQLLEGTKTESGESFDRTSYAAACNGFRLGSEVDVINVKNGKTVTVKINNRITSESKYFILLTPQAAREIDMEWETGLVVINADFTDVNSTEILPINGLVAEGSFDEETVKQFPSIKWPSDKGEDIIVETEVETIEDPLMAKVKTPVEKEEKILLIDGGGPLIKAEREKAVDVVQKEQKEQQEQKEEVVTFYPEDEKLRFPDKVMQTYILDEDAVVVLENGEKLEPAVEKVSEPYKVLKVQNLDEDKLDTYTPGIEEFSKPDIAYALLDSDSIGDPMVETGRTPDFLYAQIDTEDKDMPGEEKPEFPQKDYDILLGPDSTEGPAVELIKTPDVIADLLDSDTELLPNEEKLYSPEKEEDFTYLSSDKELDVVSPHIEEVKTPVYVPTQFDNDFDNRPDIEMLKEPERDYYAALSDDELERIIEEIKEKDEPEKELLRDPSVLDAALSSDRELIEKDEPEQELIKNPSSLYAALSTDREIEKEEKIEEYPGAYEKPSPADRESPISGDYDVVEEEVKVDDQQRKIREEKAPVKEQKRTIREERRVVKEEPEDYVEGEAYWRPSLEKGKLYIRLYTSFDKAEASSKLVSLEALLPGVKGLAVDGKYIIFYGPVSDEQASRALEGIRSFGFRDAYIVRMK